MIFILMQDENMPSGFLYFELVRLQDFVRSLAKKRR
jgi:hypothetical protein